MTKNTNNKTRKLKNNHETNTVSDNISKKIQMNTNLIIEAYKKKIENNPLPKFEKNKVQTFSEGFIRRMGEPIF
jgi:hypothetical protein